MYTIIWDFGKFTENKASFEDKDEANTVWQLLKEAGATNMRPEKEATKFHVRVSFSGKADNLFSYENSFAIARKTAVIVPVTDSRTGYVYDKLSVVMECSEVPISEINKIAASLGRKELLKIKEVV